MGMMEAVKEMIRLEGMDEGMEKGIKKGIRESKGQFVKNLILQLGFSDEKAAKAAEVSVTFVRKIRRSLKHELACQSGN